MYKGTLYLEQARMEWKLRKMQSLWCCFRCRRLNNFALDNNESSQGSKKSLQFFCSLCEAVSFNASLVVRSLCHNNSLNLPFFCVSNF